MLVKSCMTTLLLSFGLMAGAAQAADQQESPEQVVRGSVQQLMSKIDDRQQYYSQHGDELGQVVEQTIGPIVDWRYTAASVMGKYFRPASPEQRSRFADVFKQTLIDTYAQGLVTFNYKSINVLDNDQQRYQDQATVQMDVVSDSGEHYPVSYTLKQRDGQWKVVNVVVNGINLGLTYRNQFDQAMRDNNRDYDKVISNWSPEDVDLEKGGDDS
nr:ABC transporter substrate-binding protein [Kushneria phosphatilytica]